MDSLIHKISHLSHTTFSNVRELVIVHQDGYCMLQYPTNSTRLMWKYVYEKHRTYCFKECNHMDLDILESLKSLDYQDYEGSKVANMIFCIVSNYETNWSGCLKFWFYFSFNYFNLLAIWNSTKKSKTMNFKFSCLFHFRLIAQAQQLIRLKWITNMQGPNHVLRWGNQTTTWKEETTNCNGIEGVIMWKTMVVVIR